MWNNLPEQISTFNFGTIAIKVVVPNNDAVKQQFNSYQLNKIDVAFPYWCKVWDSAIALSQFLWQNPMLIKDKKVLEIAGGLGLPSLLVASIANEVICTDYIDTPFYFLQKSIQVNNIKNLDCSIFNWFEKPLENKFDIVLLSDVNYEPKAFEAILKLIEYYLTQNTTIVLSTPQRLQGKLFVEQISKYIHKKETMAINNSWIEVFILNANLLL